MAKKLKPILKTKPTLKELLLSDVGRGKILVPRRGERKRRPPIPFD
jgi:hypothetical protein